MATYIDQISKIESRLEKIPCLKDEGCNFQKEILDNIKTVVAMLEANHIELTDLRQGFAILMEDHGISMDEIKGWDLNTYRREKDVRSGRIQNGRNENKNDMHRKGSFIKRKIEERKIRRGKKNVKKIRK